MLAPLPLENAERHFVQGDTQSVAVLGPAGLDRRNAAMKVDLVPGEMEDVPLPQTRREGELDDLALMFG